MELKARIDRMVHSGKVKAIASVSLDEKYVVKNLRVVDGNKGLFVAFPQETYTDKEGKKHYSNVFFPTTNSAKYDLEDAVLNAYRQALNQGHTPQQGHPGGYDRGYGISVDDDTNLGMHM
jgi:stage V sporulation protein G